MGGTTPQAPAASPAPHQNSSQYPRHSASPAPGFNPSAYTPQNAHAVNSNPAVHMTAHQYSTPGNYSQYHQPSSSQYRPGQGGGNAYVPPKQTEVYTLGDAANAQIPFEVRESFHTDDQGRILFFTAPPLDVSAEIKPGDAIGHSIKYLAEKARREEKIKEKRRLAAEADSEQEQLRKKARTDEEKKLKDSIELLKRKGIEELARQMNIGTDQLWADRYGNFWQEAQSDMKET